MKRFYILTVCMVLLAAGIFFCKEREPSTIAASDGLAIKKEWLAVNVHPVTPKEYVRPADQTFLTFPEWYLVFSPDEQAMYFENHTATGFPYMQHVAQIWQSYNMVNNQIQGNFPVNTGYHFMIWVIGTSATVEYAMKAWYETVIGRLTDTRTPVTEEDKFTATYNRAYVTFINDRPWYEFDFKTQLKTLWGSTSFFGNHSIRKIERRYMLTSELLVKYFYGKLIGIGTQTVYSQAGDTTAVLCHVNISGAVQPQLIKLPRYDKFGKAVLALAKQGYVFDEVAGNTSAILISLLLPAGNQPVFTNADVIFTQPVASDRSIKRLAIATPVSNLNKLLLQADSSHMQLEHVFDF